MTIWDEVLETMRARMPEEDFRRWFGAIACAMIQGSITCAERGVRRHIDTHYREAMARALTARGRPTATRLVVGGEDEDDEEG